MKALFLCGVALFVAACIFPTPVCGCVPNPGIATVFGNVTRSGAPVAGAEVKVGSRAPACDNPLVDTGPAAITNSAGDYRYTLMGYADSVCLRVVARGPAHAAGDSAAADPVLARLAPRDDPLAKPESVHVDLQLPAGP